MKKMVAFAFAILALLFFVNTNTYVIHSYVEETGYAIPKNNIGSVLNDRNTNQGDAISLVAINEEEKIYQNGKTFYVGEEKNEIDMEYPLLVKKGAAMRFTSSSSSLISTGFQTYPTYEGMYVSNGISFNSDGQQADDDTMMLVQLKNGLYMNTLTINIKTVFSEYEFPVNSISNFAEEYINSYRYDQGKFRFLAIRGLQNATVSIGDSTMSYTDFLKNLDVIKEEIKKEQKEQEKIEEEIKETEKDIQASESDKKKDDTAGSNTKPGNSESGKDQGSTDEEEPGKGTDDENKNDQPELPVTKPEKPAKPITPTDPTTPEIGEGDNGDPGETPSDPGGDHKPGEGGGGSEDGGDGDGGEEDPTVPPSGEYVKPTVTCTELQPWVYTTHTELTINDPSLKIIRSVRFNVYDETGKLILRKQYRGSTIAAISTLPPDSTLYIQGTFQYYDKSGQKVDETFLELTRIETLPIEDNVADVNVTYEEHQELSASKLQLDQMQLQNDNDYDPTDVSLENFYKNTLPYIDRMTFTFTNKTTDEVITNNLNKDMLKKLTSRQLVDIATGSVLKSNSVYEYTIQIYDRFGNELPTVPDNITGEVITAKKKPSLAAKISENKANKFQINLTLTDADTAITNQHYKVQIFNEAGEALALTYQTDTGVEGTDEKEIYLSTDPNASVLTIKNLPYNQKLTFVATADFDLNDHLGEQNDIINKTTFYSASLEAGMMYFDTYVTDILGTSATVNFELNKKTTASLAELMTDFTLMIEGGEDAYAFSFNEEEINSIDLSKYYDPETGILTIQEANQADVKMKITMSIPKELMQQEGITPWKALMNGAFYGVNSGNAGSLHVYFHENTLTPNTTYTMTMDCFANQGGYEYRLKNVLSQTKFTTKKKEPQVIYDDMFLSQKFIEFFELGVMDDDEVILTDTYIIQLVQNDQVLQSYKNEPNEIIDSVRFSSLSANQEYEIRFIASEYNDTDDPKEKQKEVVFKTIKFNTADGVEASLSLDDMQTIYNNEDMNGNLDLEAISYNKGFNTSNFSQTIDKEGYFVTDFIPFDKTTATLLQNFGSGNSRIVVYKTDKSYYTNFSYNSSLFIGSKLNLSINDNWQYIRIEGMMGFEKQASVVTSGFTENLVNESIVKSRTALDTYGKESLSVDTTASDFIPIEDGSYYYTSGTGTVKHLLFYDKDKNSVGYRANQYGKVPQNTAYIRVNLTGEDVKDFNANYVYILKDLILQDNMYVDIRDKIKDHNETLSTSTKYEITRYETENLEALRYEKNEAQSLSFNLNGETVDIDEVQKMTLAKNMAYKFELSIEYHGKTISLDELEFQTNKKTYVLRSEYDLYKLGYDPNGNFIAANDITETNDFYLSYVDRFYGTLDFQGHTLKLDDDISQHRLVNCMYESSIKNIRVEGALKSGYYFIYGMYGTIDNIVYAPRTITGYKTSGLVRYLSQNAVLSNFIVEFDGDYRADYVKDSVSGILCNNSDGVIKNGYVYNKSETGRVFLGGSTGVVVGTLSNPGKIENVYSAIDLYSNYYKEGYDKLFTNSGTGIIAGKNNSGIVRNVLAVGDRYQYYTDDENRLVPDSYDEMIEPTFGYVSSKDYAKGSYVVSKYDGYTKWNAERKTIEDLWDQQLYSTFEENGFDVQSTIPLGYYPQLSLSPCMQKYQAYIKLPKMQEELAPQLVENKVTKQTEEYAEVTLKFINKDDLAITKINVENISCVIYEQKKVDDYYEVIVRLTNPTKFVSSYKVTSFQYRTNSYNKTVYDDEEIKAEFFQSINSFDDWKLMKANPTANYRLKTDLDFSILTDYNPIWIDTFDGVLDGGIYDSDGNLTGYHTLKNIEPIKWTKNSAIFNSVKGTIKNLYIDGFVWKRTTVNHSALMYTLYGTIDNVHVRNSNISGVSYTSFLTCSLNNNAVIKNSSIKNSSLSISSDVPVASYTNVQAGGFSANTNGGEIRNCYAYNLNIDTSGYTKDIYAGGIIGNGANTATYIEDCYVKGSIKGHTFNGGIQGIGNARIKRCYSDVTINATGQMNGGISGAAKSSVMDSLSIGNILVNSSEKGSTHRISGEASTLGYNNYSFINQTINNENPGTDDADGLLTTAQLSNEDTYLYKIKLGNAYDYTNVSEGFLPRLKSTKGELLPDQELLATPSDSLKLNVISAQQYDENYEVSLEVEHSGYQIDSVSIDGLSTESKQEATNDNLTTYAYRMKKIYAFDVYKAKVVLSKNGDSKTKVTLETTINFGAPVYWEISDINTWKSIMKDHGDKRENFKIKGIIDFKDETPNVDLSVNRLEGIDPETSKLINIQYKGTSTYRTMFKDIITGLSNIGFDGIDISYTNSGLNTIGLIGTTYGTVSDCTFNDVDITYFGHASQVGIIGMSRGNLENIQLENITVKGTSLNTYTGNYAGSLASYSYGHLKNISGKNIIVETPNINYVGGIVGSNNRTLAESNSCINVNIEDSSVTGNSHTGGLIGHNYGATVFNYTAKNVEVIGKSSNTGGLIGSDWATLNNNDIEGVSVENVTVTGTQYVGGVKGNGSGVTNLKAKNINVTGSEWYVGGILGYGYANRVEIQDSTISGKSGIGGISGYYQSETSRATVINCDISGTSYVAGILGTPYPLYSNGIFGIQITPLPTQQRMNAVYNSRITATEDYVGGITSICNYTGGTPKFESVVSGTTIQGDNYVGGLAGKVYSIQTTDVASSSVRDSKIIANTSYVGGIFGEVELENEFRFADVYVADIEVSAKSNAGGLFGSIKKVDGINKVAFIKRSLIYKTTVSCYDESTSDLIAPDYRSIIGDDNIYGIKIDESSVINNKSARNAGIWEDEKRQHVEIISDSDMTYELFANAVDNATRPGLSWNIGRYTYFSALVLNRDYGAGTNKNEFYLTPLNYKKQIYRMYADVADGDYQVIYNNKVVGVANISDKRADVTLSGMPTDNANRTLIVKIQKRVESGVNSNPIYTTYFSNSVSAFNTVEILDGDTYYEGNDVAPQTVTIKEGTYTWYRGTNYGYSTVAREVVKGVTGNTIKLTSRGYYYAINNATGEVSPLITFDTYGYLPNVMYWSDFFIPYQEGMADPTDYSTAYSTSDGYYEGGVKLDYVPRTATTKLGRSVSGVTQKLPSTSVYASGVDSINLEFSRSMQAYASTGLEVSVQSNGETKTYINKDRVMSIGYDFSSEMVITVSNGVESKDITITPSDVKQSVSTYGNSYYYLVKDGVKNETTLHTGEYVHLYQKEALTQDGQVYDLESGSTRVASSLGEILSTRSLQQSTTSGQTLNVFQGFTQSAGQENHLQLEQVLYSKRGTLYGLDGNMSRKGSAVLVDDYNGKQYVTVLGDDGKLINIRDEIKVPDGFRNENIKEISSSIDSNTTIVLIRYQDGTLVGFDYLTGKEIDVESISEDIGFYDFAMTSLMSLFDAPMISIQQEEQAVPEFEKILESMDVKDLTVLEKVALELRETKDHADATQEGEGNEEPAVELTEEEQEVALHETAVKQQEENKVEKQPYITIYDATSERYVTYRSKELLNEEQPISENEKIEKATEEGESLTIATEKQPAAAGIRKGNTGVVAATIVIFMMIGSLLLVLKRKRKLLN